MNTIGARFDPYQTPQRTSFITELLAMQMEGRVAPIRRKSQQLRRADPVLDVRKF
jgi:hypothetical protein